MPGRNIYKEFASDSFYHIYSRGTAKQEVFLDKQDYETFLALIKRYLGAQTQKNRSRGIYPNYRNNIQLHAYCLMPNHIHLLVHQTTPAGMSKFMQSLMVSYSMYFNRKYNRVGPVFQSRYRASRILNQSYLEHISRYIHLNPRNWETYPYSSLQYYRNEKHADWIDHRLILSIFTSIDEYLSFLKDYEDHKQMLEEIKWDLANNED